MQSKWQTETLSKTYLEGVRGAMPFADTHIELITRIARSWHPGLSSILDLGCGDGLLGRALLDAFPHAAVTFLDFSDPMLEALKEKVRQDERVKIVRSDFTSPEWKSGFGTRFDLVVSGLAIHHQLDARKKELYAEIFELLSPGGIFLHLEHVASATPRVKSLFDEYFVDRLFRYHSSGKNALKREEVAAKYYNRADKVENILVPVESQCEWLRRIGFEDVDCFFKTFEIALFGGRRP